ncbi:MAG: alpha/beta hydrolase [Desertimonas sp.]|nr:alpha/beta hydrolase [Desertimonas sp.]
MADRTAGDTLTDDENDQLGRANASGRTPVVFVHGLWLLAGSWDRWIGHFEDAGYGAVAPSWPNDPPTVAAARDDPAALAGTSVGDVAEHLEQFVRRLARKPALIGHSFGGVLTQIVAGRGLAAASVAIDPAPHRGVLPLPFSSLRAAFPVLRNPLNRGRAVGLSYDQFRYAFGNAVDEAESRRLHEEFSVAAPGKPLFQAAAANFNPRSELKVDTKNPARGPMLIISGELDHTVPWAISRATFQRQRRNPGVTELAEIAGRGHSLTIDSGWREVADTALAFVRRFT